MSAITFDTLEYSNQLREVGLTELQASVLAKKTSEILKIAVDSAKEEVHAGDLATKRDLKELELTLKHNLKEVELTLKRDLKEVELLIEKSKNSTLLWMFAMLTGVVGIMAKGFHWF